jgi:hypothetical protein
LCRSRNLQKNSHRYLEIKYSSINIIASWCVFPSPPSFPTNCICAAGPIKPVSSLLNNSSGPISSSPLIPANKPFRPANGFSLTSAQNREISILDRVFGTATLQNLPHFGNWSPSAPIPTSPRIQNQETRRRMSPHPDPAISKQSRTASPSCRNRVPTRLGICRLFLSPCSVCPSTQSLEKHGMEEPNSVSRVQGKSGNELAVILLV